MPITLTPSPHFPVRDDILPALERYLNNGIMPGGFLTACLENNLSEAFGRADRDNSQNLRNIIGYIYNYLPSNTWGSPEKVTTYVISLTKP